MKIGKYFILYVALFVFSCTASAERPAKEITNFKSCVEAGYPVLKTLPGRCNTPDGKTFVDESAGQQKNKKSLCVDSCGNGQCEEMVCMGEGCPCPESHESCPSDCPA